jgi:hypothetical protein
MISGICRTPAVNAGACYNNVAFRIWSKVLLWCIGESLRLQVTGPEFEFFCACSFMILFISLSY